MDNIILTKWVDFVFFLRLDLRLFRSWQLLLGRSQILLRVLLFLYEASISIYIFGSLESAMRNLSCLCCFLFTEQLFEIAQANETSLIFSKTIVPSKHYDANYRDLYFLTCIAWGYNDISADYKKLYFE